MEGLDFGGRLHPVLRGLLCRGKVVSVWFLLFLQGDKQITGLILTDAHFLEPILLSPLVIVMKGL